MLFSDTVSEVIGWNKTPVEAIVAWSLIFLAIVGFCLLIIFISKRAALILLPCFLASAIIIISITGNWGSLGWPLVVFAPILTAILLFKFNRNKGQAIRIDGEEIVCENLRLNPNDNVWECQTTGKMQEAKKLLGKD